MPLILFALRRCKAVVSLVAQAPSLACTLLFARHAPAGLGLNRKPAGVVLSTGYSWLPGTRLNLIPRFATPTGAAVGASIVSAVPMMLIDVAAMAVVP